MADAIDIQNREMQKESRKNFSCHSNNKTIDLPNEFELQTTNYMNNIDYS